MSIYKIRTEFGKHLRIVLAVIALIFIVGCFFSFGPGPSGQGGRNSDQGGVVARINGEEVTMAEYNALVTKTEQFMSQMGSNSPLDYADMKGYLIQQMVQKKLLIQAAKSEGVDLSERKIDEAVDKKVVEVMNSFRAKALGLSQAEASKLKTDPRQDAKYKEQLGMVNRTIGQEEERARSMVSRDDVLYEMATKQLESIFKSKTEKVTDADIKKSYDVYGVRMIVISKDKFPAEQALTRANKIAEEAKSGDFAKLAREYSVSPTTGDVQQLTFESMNGYPANVKDAIDRLKPGQVSRALKTDMGYFIIKLENKGNTLPAKLDKKTKNERRKAIEQSRMMVVGMEFQKKMDPSKAKVEILDNELKAYWTLGKASQTSGNQKETEKLQKLALSLLQKAVKENPNNAIAMAKMAQLYQQTGNDEAAKTQLLQILEGDKVSEDASLRMMLGDIYAKEGDKADAVAQYKIASETAQNDTKVHTELVQKYKGLGSADLAASEEQWLKDYDVKKKEWEKLQQGAPSQTAPAPAPAPTKK